MNHNKIDEIYNVLSELRIAKNADYGDSYAEQGPVGILVRQSDKINRLLNISKKGVTIVSSEAIEDTVADLVNYALMYLERSVDDVYEFRKRILKEG